MEQNERQLFSLLSEITPLYEAPMREAKARQDALAKPPGSLGLLEDLSVQLAGITGHIKNEVSHTRIYVLAADNGVVCEGVSSAPQSVTRAQAINLTRGLTGASCLAKHFHDGLMVVDMGIALSYTCPEILNRSLGKGTANIAAGPAMTRQTAVQGILTGMELAAQAKRDGIQILGVGEMGIGNTTTSSAVAVVLLGRPAAEMTGRGAGLSDEGLHRKIHAIERGIAVNHPNAADPLGVLAALGGFDIADIRHIIRICHARGLRHDFQTLIRFCHSLVLGGAEHPLGRRIMLRHQSRPIGQARPLALLPHHILGLPQRLCIRDGAAADCIALQDNHVLEKPHVKKTIQPELRSPNIPPRTPA